MTRINLDDSSLIAPTAGIIRNVCVYCGSAQGAEPIYIEAAAQLGRILAAAHIGLVYGGGNTGLMGAIARSTLAHGGFVTGIIPQFLTDREVALETAQDLIVVPDMHTRKRLMFEKADAFVALPGGIGTLEELVEQLTWVQLERHTKPVLLADIGAFWRPLLDLFEHMRERRFIQTSFEVRYLVAEAVEDILPMLETAAERTAILGRAKTQVDPRL
ncbi:MAG: TIGR00730 family Rossman fold protein [Methylovirgula sp.]|nr:TIGR00730 family Rossman fold protein [Methylovirgula sp.]